MWQRHKDDVVSLQCFERGFNKGSLGKWRQVRMELPYLLTGVAVGAQGPNGELAILIGGMGEQETKNLGSCVSGGSSNCD